MKNLAIRMRPKKIEDMVGQEHLLSKNKVISKMVKANQLSSLILYGPPGIGKTSLAYALSGTFGFPLYIFNAAIHGKKELKEYTTYDKPLILIIDEIQRLTRPNQEFLLPYIEDGSIVLIGMTTENPKTAIIPAIASRTLYYELKPLKPEQILQALKKAINTDKELPNVELEEGLLENLAHKVQGDLRTAYNSLEILMRSADNKVTLQDLEELLRHKNIRGDKSGTEHYDLLSALQKSIRGSDVDASLHYAARLLEIGDLTSLKRRLLVISYEDIGTANPTLHSQIIDACNTAEQIGLPEARIPISFAVVEMALSPKSNACYRAINNAMEDLSSGRNLEIPDHIRDGHLFQKRNYHYPHEYEYNIYKQQYLPEGLKYKRYFNPKEKTTKHEKTLKQLEEHYRELLGKN